MEILQVFNYLGTELRTIDINNELWWVLKDVCNILELSNPSMIAERLDDDELTKFDLGGQSGVSNLINESGLYNVILRSDKPKAKPFRKWVTHEVLPSIRRTGSYSVSNSFQSELDKRIDDIELKLVESRTRLAELEQKIIDEKVRYLEAEYYKLNEQALQFPLYLKDEIHKLIEKDCMI